MDDTSPEDTDDGDSLPIQRGKATHSEDWGRSKAILTKLRHQIGLRTYEMYREMEKFTTFREKKCMGRIEKINSEMVLLKGEKQLYEAELNDLKFRNEQLQGQKQALSSANAQVEKLKAEITDETAKSQALTSANAQLKSEMVEVRAKLNESEEVLADYNTHLGQLLQKHKAHLEK